MIEIYDDETIIGLFGPVGRKDYDDTHDAEKPHLLAWAKGLAEMSDDELGEWAYQAIKSAAQANAAHNWRSPAHARVSALVHESRKRWMALGHDRRCMGPSIYSLAYERSCQSFGYETTRPECTCGKGD